MKTEQEKELKCRNCGHPGERHGNKNQPSEKFGKHTACWDCTCKKFEPEEDK